MDQVGILDKDETKKEYDKLILIQENINEFNNIISEIFSKDPKIKYIIRALCVMEEASFNNKIFDFNLTSTIKEMKEAFPEAEVVSETRKLKSFYQKRLEEGNPQVVKLVKEDCESVSIDEKLDPCKTLGLVNATRDDANIT